MLQLGVLTSHSAKGWTAGKQGLIGRNPAAFERLLMLCPTTKEFPGPKELVDTMPRDPRLPNAHGLKPMEDPVPSVLYCFAAKCEIASSHSARAWAGRGKLTAGSAGLASAL